MSTPRRGTGNQTGARSVGDHDKKGGGWWKWLLALLLLLLALFLLLSLLDGDDDDKEQSTTAAQTASPTATEPSADPSASAGAGAGAGGTLTADGTALLPVPVAGLTDFAGQAGEGKGVEVQSVVQDEGFFVGTSDTDRVYVEYGGDVGDDETDGFTPKVGDKVDLTGPVRPAPEDPASTLNLSDAADADLVTQQGAYVNADTVTEAAQ